MLDLWYRLLDTCLPFEWSRYVFMKNALLALLLATPSFALLGSEVIGSRMVFFSDVLGHAGLTGIAIGVLLGLGDPLPAMIVFAAVLAVAVNLLRIATKASSDTILGVIFAFVIAFGVALLSRGGGFARFSGYLIGDVLTVTPHQTLWLAILLLAVLAYWTVLGNALMLADVSPALAATRGVRTFLVETGFSVLLAVVVTCSIRLVGILMINSLLVLPAAAGRNLARSIRAYTFWSVAISVTSGIGGLIVSYYLDMASGATIVLFAAAFYLVSAVIAGVTRRGARTA